MSWRLALLNIWLRLREKPYLARATDPAESRARMEAGAALFPMPKGARWDWDAPVGGVPAARLEAPPVGAVILWLHGGAYCLGSPRTHAAMIAALAVRAGAGAILPEYRLAPEHVFPAAVEDAIAGWRGLVAEGVPPERIVVGGDSAGGGLALALLHEVLAEGGAPPSCVLLFSPWVDLTLSGGSLATNARRDVLLPLHRVAEIRDRYLDGADPRDPRASPLFGAYSGAPPVLIQTSRDEILRDDAVRLAEHLRAQGVAVELDLRPRVPHVWQAFQGSLPEADAALDRAAAFVRCTVDRRSGSVA